MKRLRLNREFAVRHIGVALLMFGLSCWFAYDGYVEYPRHDDEWFEQRHLKKESATRRQREFMVLAFIAALVIAGHVAVVARLDFEYDDEGFVCGGEKRSFALDEGILGSFLERWKSHREMWERAAADAGADLLDLHLESLEKGWALEELLASGLVSY